MANELSGELRFAASAKLQRLLGRDLLPDDYSAVEELVKNAYDSNATAVTITLVRANEKDSGLIEIRDNGTGLSLISFKRVWMWAGYSEKTAEPLPDTKRIQVGEKGIGRFAADKLGERLVVITKVAGPERALRVDFDWRKFANQKKLLSDIPVRYEFVGEPTLQREQSGTILRIEKLRSGWEDRELRELRVRLARLLNPYQKTQAFKITLITGAEKLSGPIVPGEIRNADFEWEISKGKRGKVTVKRRHKVIGADGGTPIWSEWETISEELQEGEAQDFGPVAARFLYFSNRPRKADIDSAIPGVGVYRDGLRVEPEGSAEADWLGLLAKRAKRAGHMPLVPSRLFGYVEIGRESNPDLRDATNRRAFIQTSAFSAFTTFLKRRLAELEAEVEQRVAKPRWEKSRQVKSQKLIQAGQRTLSVLSLGLAHELRQPLTSIHAASENIDTHLKKQGVNIPQVQEAVDTIQRNVTRIDKHIVFLKDLGSHKEEIEPVSIDDLVSEIVEEFTARTTARAITLARHGKVGHPVKFNRWSVLMTLTNLLINALEALEGLPDPSGHRVEIRIQDEPDRVTLQVNDDGPGIAESLRARLFRRETTSKQGGMGVALIICRDAMRTLGGDLSCVSFGSPTSFAISIPKEVGHGTHPLN